MEPGDLVCIYSPKWDKDKILIGVFLKKEMLNAVGSTDISRWFGRGTQACGIIITHEKQLYYAVVNELDVFPGDAYETVSRNLLLINQWKPHETKT